MRKIVLAGLGPWGPYKSSSASAVALALDGEILGSYRNKPTHQILGGVIPANYSTFNEILKRAIEAGSEEGPDNLTAVIGLHMRGMDEGKKITAELSASGNSYVGIIKDEEGVSGKSRSSSLLPSSVNPCLESWFDLARSLNETKVPFSLDARRVGFLGDEMYRQIIQMAGVGRIYQPNFLPGFLTLPHAPEHLQASQKVPKSIRHTIDTSVSIEIQVEQVRTILEALLKHI